MDLIEKFGIGYYPQNTTGTKIMQVRAVFLEQNSVLELSKSDLSLT
jgi:hypothetical protein